MNNGNIQFKLKIVIKKLFLAKSNDRHNHMALVILHQ